MIHDVPSTGYAELLINAGDGPTMIINRDEVNVLYIGNDNSVASKQGSGDISIIDPLSFLSFDGEDAKYGTASVGVIQADVVKGAINWAPSPAQAAQQIALLGLATSANQSSQITAANLGNLTAGVIQNISSTITGNHIALQSMVGNPFFTNPNGSADATGWTVRQATFQTAGLNGAVSLPAGSGQPNGIFVTATGAPAQFQWGGSGASAFPVVPGQFCNGHFMINPQQTGTAFAGIAFFTSNGTFISTLSTNTPINTANIWQKIFTSVQAPPTAAFADPVFGLTGNGVGNTYYATAAIAYATGQPGSIANDHAQAIAGTGAPLIHGVQNVFSATNVALPANNTQFFPGASAQTTVVGISYEGFVTLSGAVNPTSIDIDFSWYENGILVYEERRWFYVGTVASPHSIFFKGPSKGSSVNVSIGGAVNATTIVAFQFNTSSRPTDKDEWRTLSGQFQSGAANGTGVYDLAKNLILAYNFPAQAAGNTQVLCLPYWEGKFSLDANTGSNTTDLQVIMDDIPTVGDNTSWFNRKSDASGFLEVTESFMPRTQQKISIRNANAAAETINCFLVTNQY